jgi:uncharacterized protein (DUF2384 family)
MNARQFGILRNTLKIFGSKRKARIWLSRPFEIFEGKNTLQMIETEEGCEILEDFLIKLRYVFDPRP